MSPGSRGAPGRAGGRGGNTGGNRIARFRLGPVGPLGPTRAMAIGLSESRVDHRGDPLPEGVYALVDARGGVVSYKDRWRELDANGVQRQRSKSFSPRGLGSLDQARRARHHVKV